eukprot:jgi/Ulvmu1/6434/UM003_0063.1
MAGMMGRLRRLRSTELCGYMAVLDKFHENVTGLFEHQTNLISTLLVNAAGLGLQYEIVRWAQTPLSEAPSNTDRAVVQVCVFKPFVCAAGCISDSGYADQSGRTDCQLVHL